MISITIKKINMIKASFVICFHTARFENLLQTLNFLIKNHKETIADSELVTVCQDSIEFKEEPDLSFFLKNTSLFKQYKHFNMEEEEMVLAKMINRGITSCSSNCVIVLESDRIFPAGYFASVIEQLKPKTCITCRKMKKLQIPVGDEQIENENFEFVEEYRSEENHIGARNMWSGNTAFWRDDFFEADMMDEGYVGYGWADSDMTNKMNEIGVKNIFRDEIELHLWHPPLTYGKADQKALFIQNGIRYCRKWNIEYPDWFKEEIKEHKKKTLL